MQLDDEVDRLLETPPGRRRLVRGHGQPEHRDLPGVLAAHLRDRDVEAVPDPLRDGADHAALLLQRLGAVDVKLHAGGPDDHSGLRTRTSTSALPRGHGDSVSPTPGFARALRARPTAAGPRR